MSSPLTVRPAVAADADAETFLELLPDRWRPGGNRRSLVAHSPDGRVLGHCRGIDNAFHPASRTLVLEVAPQDRIPREQIEDALLPAQRAVSTLPLRLKPEEGSPEVDLCRRQGGVLVQLMPPWRFTVDAGMRAWAARRLATGDGLRATGLVTVPRADVLSLYVEHYRAQHAAWSPAAAAEELSRLNAPDILDGPASEVDAALSTVLVRDGQLGAQALVWPPEPDGGREVTLQCRWPETPTSREDREACLAATISRVPEGTALLIDSHVTETTETEMMRALRAEHPAAGPWVAIVGIPATGGQDAGDAGTAPVPLPTACVPPEALAFVRSLNGR